jgi:hypothetical protein
VVGQGALAVVDVGNDGEVADVVHGVLFCAAGRKTQGREPLQRKLISRRDVKPRSGVLKLKKRHVEEATCLPTKGMATACWAFIVAKRTGRETAPALVSRPLQPSNKDFYSQVINKFLWITCGSNRRACDAPRFRRRTPFSVARERRF